MRTERSEEEMMCDECGKREATVRFEQVVNGKRMVMNLCSECAHKKGIMSVFLQPSFTISNLLSALLGSQVKGMPALEAGGEETRCPVCGMSYRDFARAGMLGCSRCYKTFEDRLDPLLRRIHGSDKHVGKAPAKVGGSGKLRRELDGFRKELSQAISQEAYEKAAQLRDKIKELEQKIRGEEA
jgi:protein arginine kinase activator